HLALLSTRLPALVSERDEDPLFNDDWEASTFLYPKTSPSSPSSNSSSSSSSSTAAPPSPPPITLLVVSVSSSRAEGGESTILFDPSREELAVADAVVAISLGVGPQSSSSSSSSSSSAEQHPPTTTTKTKPELRLLALRTIDPPSRLTSAGTPDSLNTTTTTSPAGAGGNSGGAEVVVVGQDLAALKERVRGGGSTGTGGNGTGTGGEDRKDAGKDTVWYPPRGGGLKRGSIARM
ncbi:hypothetical protein KC341_g19283, partial [Hortaea werneckii]